MDELCPHDDDPATCPPCRRAAGKDQPPAEAFDTRIVLGSFVARFSGHCIGCHLPIHEGQRCVRTEHGRTVHLGCE